MKNRIEKNRVLKFADFAKNFLGVIFDLDGTILDSLWAWKNLAKNYLLRFGISSSKNLDEIFFNMSMKESAAFLKKNFPLKKTEEEIFFELNSILKSAYENEIDLTAGADAALRFCKKCKMKIVAATAGERFLEEAALRRCGVLDFFEKIFTCTEEGTSKTEAKIFLRAADFMNLPPKKILVAEDSDQAIKVAKAAGFAVWKMEGRF